MSVVIVSGAVYFAVVFAAGFVLGAIRLFLVAPHVGNFWAVVIELPVILAISWVVCRKTIQWCNVPDDTVARLGMGSAAFALLMIAEWALVGWGQAAPLAAFWAHLTTVPGMIGLGGQLIFAAFPVFQRQG